MAKRGKTLPRATPAVLAGQNVLTSNESRPAQPSSREIRRWVFQRLLRIAQDPDAPKGHQISALKAIDDLTPADPPERVDGGEPTPSDARQLIKEFFGQKVTSPKPSAEVDGIVGAFPGSDLAGAP
jgi:hypothetical protein